MRRALAAWLALTAAEVATVSPTTSSLSNTTTTTIDPWSPLLGDTEGAPTVTEPSPARRRGEESLVESIRLQLMHDNYDYVGKGSAEATQTPQNTGGTSAGRAIQQRMTIPASQGRKALNDDGDVQAYVASPQYKAVMDEEFALSQPNRQRSTEYTVTVTEKDLLYYLDDNYMRYKYLVSEIPFGRRSYNNTVYVNSVEHQTPKSINRTNKQIKNQEYRRQTSADLSNIRHDQQKNIQQIIETKSTLNSNLNDQHDEWNSDHSDENKNVSNKNDYSNEFLWGGNSNISEISQKTANRRMYYKRPPNDEIENIRRYRKKKLKKFNSFSHKNKALRNAVLRDKANFRRNKMYDEHNKVRQESQKYIQHLRKYKQQRHKNKKLNSQVSPYQLKTKMRPRSRIWHQQQPQSDSRYRLLQRRRYQKDYLGYVQPDRIHDTTDDDEENVSQTNNPSNNELTPDKHEDKQINNLSHHQDEQNGSLSEEEEYKEGQQNDQQMNQIQSNIDKDDDETDGSWKQSEKKRYDSNSLEHDIRTGKLIVENRRMDTPVNDTQFEIQDVKYEDGLNETQYENIEDGNETQLKDGQNYTPSKDIMTSTPSAKYKLIKVKSGGSRRSQKAERQFLQERRADGGVALIALDGGPFPQFRLPLSRRQYMFESHHKHNPLKDQLPKAARLTHNHLN